MRTHSTCLAFFAKEIVVMQNHCCTPSMYTKVVEVEGESRLVFFARTDIKPGQELTYDYRYTAIVMCPPVLTGALVQYFLSFKCMCSFCMLHDDAMPTSQKVSVSIWCVHQHLAACIVLGGSSSRPAALRLTDDS